MINPVSSVPFIGSRYPQSAVLRDVLSEMLSNGTSEVMVVDESGLEQGILSKPFRIEELFAPVPT